MTMDRGVLPRPKTRRTAARASESGGGVVAVRGFAYQFDQTILECFLRPTEVITVEHVEDFNGAEWCVQSKGFNSQFQPSILSKAIANLWREHQADVTRKLHLYCHFTDRAAGETKTYDTSSVPKTWRRLLTVDGQPASDDGIAAFLANLKLHFCENFEAQFHTLVDRIRAEWLKADVAEAVVTHSVMRAHMMELATRRMASERTTSLERLREIDGEVRKVILEAGHRELIGEEGYVQLVRKRLFHARLNLDAADRLFIFDVGPSDDLGALAGVWVQLANRYFRRMRTGPKGLAPVICVRGLTDAQFSTILNQVHNDIAAAIDLEAHAVRDIAVVDGVPFRGADFRLTELTRRRTGPFARLRVLGSDFLDNPEVSRWIAAMPYIFHFVTDRASSSPRLWAGSAHRLSVRDIAAIQRIVG